MSSYPVHDTIFGADYGTKEGARKRGKGGKGKSKKDEYYDWVNKANNPKRPRSGDLGSSLGSTRADLTGTSVRNKKR